SMNILGLLLEVMDLSAADLDNVTRPRLPANAASQPAAPAALAKGQSQLAEQVRCLISQVALHRSL
ncbi:MAG: hypothetical protein WCC90_19230, partial [Methylocella sp.]